VHGFVLTLTSVKPIASRTALAVREGALHSQVMVTAPLALSLGMSTSRWISVRHPGVEDSTRVLRYAGIDQLRSR
jgi:hypothetical protein